MFYVLSMYIQWRSIKLVILNFNNYKSCSTIIQVIYNTKASLVILYKLPTQKNAINILIQAQACRFTVPSWFSIIFLSRSSASFSNDLCYTLGHNFANSISRKRKYNIILQVVPTSHIRIPFKIKTCLSKI